MSHTHPTPLPIPKLELCSTFQRSRTPVPVLVRLPSSSSSYPPPPPAQMSGSHPRPTASLVRTPEPLNPSPPTRWKSRPTCLRWGRSEGGTSSRLPRPSLASGSRAGGPLTARVTSSWDSGYPVTRDPDPYGYRPRNPP